LILGDIKGRGGRRSHKKMVLPEVGRGTADGTVIKPRDWTRKKKKLVSKNYAADVAQDRRQKVKRGSRNRGGERKKQERRGQTGRRGAGLQENGSEENPTHKLIRESNVEENRKEKELRRPPGELIVDTIANT